MKKSLIISTFFTSSLLFANYMQHNSLDEVDGNSFEKMLENGNFSANLNFFHMVRTFDNVKPDTKAFTGGGIIKYESESFHGMKLGVAYYGSHKIGGFYSRKEGIRTSLLQGNGDDIAFLGEAYLSYTLQKTILKIGRQRLDTPLMGDLYLRVAPTAYEAAIVRSQNISKTTVEVGYVKSYTGFGSRYSGFNDKNRLWGKDGLAYIYIQNSSLKNFSIRGQYIYALSNKSDNGMTVARRDYRYIDVKYDLPLGKESYIKVQYGGNAYNKEADSTLLGVKIGSTFFDMFESALFYDKILNNNFWVIMSSPMFTDWQQGYGLYEPSSAVGMSVSAKPIKELRVRVVYVDVSSNTERLVDDFSEFNFDVMYTINKYSKLRLSYSFKDQSDASEKLLLSGEGGREDRNDLRVIYSINF